MKRWLLLAALALGGCAGNDDPVQLCGKAVDCDPVFCLFDGGVGMPDAGQLGFNLRACVMGVCATRCK